jgi:anti-sigma-K factor RskA
MMTFSDETVMAYVDGELDDAARAALEVAMTTDTNLAERVARERRLRARLHSAFDPVLREPIPERLLAAANDTSAKARTGNIVWLKRIPLSHWSWPQWSAMAASLVLGVLIAPLLRHQPTEGPLDIRDGEVLASGAVAHALSEQLASNQATNAPVHVGVSFLSRDGDYCRVFMLRDKSALAGLACREGESWHLQVLAATDRATSGSGEYQPAASSLPPVVQQSVDALIVGEPLDAKGEAAARGKGWRP